MRLPRWIPGGPPAADREPAHERAFTQENRRRTVRSGRAGGLVVFVVTPGWAVVDRLYVPEAEAPAFLLTRVVVTALIAVAWVSLLRRPVPPGQDVMAVFGGLGALEVQTAWMLPRAGEAAAVYLLVLLVVMFGSASMVDWHWRWNAWLVVLAAVSVAVMDALAPVPLSGRERVLVWTTLVNGGLLSVYGQYTRYRRSLAEHRARLEAEAQREANAALVRELEDLSRRDALTRVWNRRAFDEALERELHRATRSGGSFAVVLLDVDHFKRVNDTHGHQVGDVVLQEVAGALAGHVRAADVVARYGGEEFAVLLPDVPRAELGGLADSLRERVRAVTALAAQEGGGVAVTLSAGAARFPDDGIEAGELLAAADAALYRAKAAGRDRSVVASA